MYPLDDTIAAIASAPGGAARGIVRISGPDAIECVTQVISSPLPLAEGQGVRADLPANVSATLRLPNLHSPLPCDLYTWPVGRSYTGQSVAEIHTLGSPPLLEMLLQAICSAGARLAMPGEFTLRAFLAGRIDLTQAEAVLGVIDANDSDSLHTALSQLAGGLARPLHELRDTLLDLLAHLEAGFDFADEDLAFITRDELLDRLAEAEQTIETIHRQMASRSDSSEHLRVVLVGRPNAGKSSLFNSLVGDRTALVSEHPGTTRDYLTADLDFDGVKCRLIDTAGTSRGRKDKQPPVGRPTPFEIEELAESSTAEQRRAAHLVLLCIDSSQPLDANEREWFAKLDPARQVVVLTKCDMPRHGDCPAADVETSTATGSGIVALRDLLHRRLLSMQNQAGDIVVGTAIRCADSLQHAGECLRSARHVAADGLEELAAAELRAALVELGRVVGEVYTDDVLDRIFSRFCVGK